MTPANTWKKKWVRAVGGLTEVGFSDDEEYLLVVSHAGRGAIEVKSGAVVARNGESPSSGSAWLEESIGEALGIGPLHGERIKVVGLWGGRLPQQTEDGWEVREPVGDLAVVLHKRSGAVVELDKPITDVRAFGFSPSGSAVLLATSSDLTLFERAG